MHTCFDLFSKPRCFRYIFKNDALGSRLLASLERAAGEMLMHACALFLHLLISCVPARGVDVRLVVDGIGSYSWLMTREENLQLQLRVWNPLPWTFASRASMGMRWRWLTSINRRNHRKVSP
jgi:phosphatidylserine/phosphatidylglycerophosphate/cardiolipin synthase-like enzyme